jgi:predicted RNase H-like HicB family nuclease
LSAWSINLESGRWWYAHVAELPGCFTRATTRGEVLSLLPGAVEAHLGWLDDRGIAHPSRSGFTIIEEQGGIQELGESGGVVALFNSDREHITAESLRRFLALMEHNRDETLGLISSLSPGVLTSYLRPGKRTVVDDVRHIVNAEEWYVSRLGRRYQRVYEGELRADRGKRRPSDVERLTLTRRSMVVALWKALTDEHQGPFIRRAYSKHPEELWTLVKVLRRFVEHEREHLGTMKLTVATLRDSHPLGGLDP